MTSIDCTFKAPGTPTFILLAPSKMACYYKHLMQVQNDLIVRPDYIRHRRVPGLKIPLSQLRVLLPPSRSRRTTTSLRLKGFASFAISNRSSKQSICFPISHIMIFGGGLTAYFGTQGGLPSNFLSPSQLEMPSVIHK
jgi:hypothetical protein